jgi:hypothetical protein
LSYGEWQSGLPYRRSNTMMRSISLFKAYRDERRGQVLVEFALTLPILLLFLIGIIELGLAVMTYNGVRFAAQEGARYAVMLSAMADPTDPTPLWKEDCNVGKDVSQSPPGDPYREWLGTTVCPVTPSVVSAALESSPVLRRTEARVRIAYHRDPPPSSSEVGLEGYNRGVPITVTVVYETNSRWFLAASGD